MGLSIWIPRADRGGVLKEWKDGGQNLLERLPLNYDDTTLRTIEQIDVLWLRGRSIVRAFEVEHTTSVYSGILRMADLLALQPNMDIKLHIVAPGAKPEKVFQEIRRPVFSLLEKGPLAEIAPTFHTTACANSAHRSTDTPVGYGTRRVRRGGRVKTSTSNRTIDTDCLPAGFARWQTAGHRGR